jgi:hypothetical protein
MHGVRDLISELIFLHNVFALTKDAPAECTIRTELEAVCESLEFVVSHNEMVAKQNDDQQLYDKVEIWNQAKDRIIEMLQVMAGAELGSKIQQKCDGMLARLDCEDLEREESIKGMLARLSGLKKLDLADPECMPPAEIKELMAWAAGSVSKLRLSRYGRDLPKGISHKAATCRNPRSYHYRPAQPAAAVQVRRIPDSGRCN